MSGNSGLDQLFYQEGRNKRETKKYIRIPKNIFLVSLIQIQIIQIFLILVAI